MRSAIRVAFWVCLPLLASLAHAQAPQQPATTTATAATAPATAPSTAPSTQPLDPTTARLVAQLDSDDWHARQQAEDQLVAAGDSVRPAMRAIIADASRSEEARSRAAAVIARLEQAAANAPTLITLKTDRQNPREVLNEIARQAHTTLTFMPENLWGPQFPVAPKVSVDLRHEPFWSALSRVCRQANARVQPNGSMNALMVMQGSFGGDMMEGPQSTSGLFTITAVSATLNRQVSFIPNARTPFNSTRDEIRFALFADPKVRLIEADAAAVLTQADDDKGHSMLCPPDVRPFFRGRLFGFGGTFSAHLQYPDDGYTKLSKVKGSLHVTIADRTQRLEIPDLSQSLNKPHTLGDWVVEVEQFQVNEQAGSLRMRVRYSGNDPSPLLRGLQDVRLTDAAGTTLLSGLGGNLTAVGSVECQSNFQSPQPITGPVKLSWDVVTESKSENIPFTFTDLPMPTIAP